MLVELANTTSSVIGSTKGVRSKIRPMIFLIVLRASQVHTFLYHRRFAVVRAVVARAGLNCATKDLIPTGAGFLISPTHTRTERRVLVWDSEFTTKAAIQQGGFRGIRVAG